MGASNGTDTEGPLPTASCSGRPASTRSPAPPPGLLGYPAPGLMNDDGRRPLTRGIAAPLPRWQVDSDCAGGREPRSQPWLARGCCRTERGRGTAACTGPNVRPPGLPPDPPSAARPPASPGRPAWPAPAASCASAPPSHPGIDTDRSAVDWPDLVPRPIGGLAGRARGPCREPQPIRRLASSRVAGHPRSASRD